MAGIKARGFSGVFAAFSGRQAADARDNGVSGRFEDSRSVTDLVDEIDLQALGEDSEHYGHFFV